MKTILGLKALDLSEYAISANALLGIRDSGKTYAGCEAAEELYDASVPSICFDPIGKWHSLRVPGKGKGYPFVVAGGRFGDLPLTRKNAGELVRSAMASRISLVLDLFSREMTKADWRYIVQECAEILLYENEEHGLRHVFIEEAGEFVPQRVTDGHVFAAVEKLVRMGGNSKLGCTLIHQRPADLNKSVLELCANIFLLKQNGKNTITDLKKWVDLVAPDIAAKIAASLPDLEPGEGWAFMSGTKTPAHFKVPARSSKHPDRRALAKGDAGADARVAVPATQFVETMKAKLAEKAKPAVRQAAPGLSTSKPVEKINAPDQKQVDHAVAAAQASGMAAGLAQGREEGFIVGHHIGAGLAAVALKYTVDAVPGILSALRDNFLGRIGEAEGLYQAQEFSQEQVGFAKIGGERILKKLRAQNRAPAASAVPPVSPSRLQIPAAQAKRSTPLSAPVGAASLDAPLQRIVDAIRYWNVFGIDAPTHHQVAFIANYVPGSGTWNRYLSSLRSSGIIEPRGDLKLTPEGLGVARDPSGDPSGEQLRASILAKIDAPLVRILTPVLEAYPTGMDHEAVASIANYVAGSGTWNRYLSSLRSLDLIEARGELKAQAWLFPEGA